MSRFHSYINTAAAQIGLYKGEQPFALFIKGFFSKNKKYGSKDRRQIAALCYNYFRMGPAMKNYPAAQKIITATFLCGQMPVAFWDTIKPEWNRKTSLSLTERLELVKDDFSIAAIFPFKEVLSESVAAETYCQSMLEQPSLYLRIRPQCRLTALKKLKNSKLEHRLLNKNCIELPPATNVEDFFILDKEVVVQDYNSQQVLHYLALHEEAFFGQNALEPLSAWDCCAASGGKSILLHDILKRKIDLTVSDIRLSIMINLHQRFKRAKIKEYKYFVEDIGDAKVKPPATTYQLIICDAPCTGSGTWSRTPEQLCFFNTASIKEYSDKQRRIVTHAIPHLKEKGIFVYITCSVFKEENEAIASFIATTFNVKLLYQQILNGTDKKADTMFVAVFKK